MKEEKWDEKSVREFLEKTQTRFGDEILSDAIVTSGTDRLEEHQKRLNLGQFLKWARIQQKLGLNKAARAATITPAYLSQLESGKRMNPSPEKMRALARVYGIDLAQLVFRCKYLSVSDRSNLLQDESIQQFIRAREGFDDLLGVTCDMVLSEMIEELNRRSLSGDLTKEEVKSLFALPARVKWFISLMWHGQLFDPDRKAYFDRKNEDKKRAFEATSKSTLPPSTRKTPASPRSARHSRAPKR